jgi:hypothetical protein
MPLCGPVLEGNSVDTMRIVSELVIIPIDDAVPLENWTAKGHLRTGTSTTKGSLNSLEKQCDVSELVIIPIDGLSTRALIADVLARRCAFIS